MVDENDNPEWTGDNTGPLDYAGKLKVIRARLKISQSAFAGLLHIPTTSLQNWEQRRTVPDAPTRILVDLVYQDPAGMRARLVNS